MDTARFVAATGHDPLAFALLAACCLIGAALTVPLVRRVAEDDPKIGQTLGFGLAVATCVATLWGAHIASIARIAPELGAGYDLRMSAMALVVAAIMSAIGVWLAAPSLRNGDVLIAAVELGSSLDINKFESFQPCMICTFR